MSKPAMSTPRPAARRGRRTTVAAAVTAVAAAWVLTGCAYEEDICSSGEYPVMTVGATGSACVLNEEQPPEGYTRYPEGKVPLKVDDKWDIYWNTHTLDKDGKIIDAP